MKLLGIESHFPGPNQTNAADWWRTIRPLQELQKQTDWQVDIRKGIVENEPKAKIFSPFAQEQLVNIGRNYDLVHFSYNSPMFFSAIMVATNHFGHTFNMDYDDNVIQQDMMNPTVMMEKMKNPNEAMQIDVMLREVPALTVTNNYLRNEYAFYIAQYGLTKRITIIPNYIDLDTYKAVEQKKNTDEVVIGFFGSTSHQADLYEKGFHKAITAIRKKYKHVRFEIIGNFIPHYLDGVGATRLIPGDPDFYRWVEMWKEHVCSWDIGVAPLRDTPFNISRSNIKWQEYGAAHIPMVASDIGLYSARTAFRAKTAKEWEEALSRLIEDKDYRLQAGQDAYAEVKQKWTIQGNWDKWKSAFLNRINSS